MSANATRRLSRAERMNRIAELFRRDSHPTATNVVGAPHRVSMMTACSATKVPVGTRTHGMPSTPGRIRKALPESAGKVGRAPSEFSHLHRSLGKDEPIPRAPGLLEQIMGLSQLLAQRPLSQQKQEALHGEESEDQPGEGLGGTGAQTDVEDEIFA